MEIRNIFARFFPGSRKTQNQNFTGGNSSEFLYNHRLKRSLEDAGSRRKGVQKNTRNHFFIFGLLLVFLFAPLKTVFAASYITLNSFSGNATTLQVSGGGWTPGEIVSIFLNSASGSPAASATVGTDSFFGPSSVVIPANAPQGAVSIIGVGSVSGKTESNSYYVVPFNPAITASASPNTPGSTNLVLGTGFAPGETVNFTLNGQTGGSVTANSGGNFTNGSFVIPFANPGVYQLHATGASSGADAINYFYVGGFYPAAYPTTYYLLPGDTLSFSGSGFALGESIQVFSASAISPVSSFKASASGNFTDAGGFTVPLDLSGGVRTFHLKGLTTNADVAVMVTVGVFNGAISPSSYYLLPGQTLNFSGNGFAPAETVNVFAGTATSPISSFVTDLSGNFINLGNIVIPMSFAGSTTHFRVAGLSSHTEAGVDITVQGFFPSISPSKYFVTPGQKFTVSGSGYASGETVNVTMSGSPAVSVSTDASGSFTGAGLFTAPFSGGPLHMVATGNSSGATASVNVALGGLFPSVSPSSYYLFSGDSISFIGSGFAPTESVNIKTGTTDVGSVVAGGDGSFASTSSPIGFGSTGNRTYSFTGQLSNAAVNLNITVGGLFPYAWADSYYATPGSTINVEGAGFASGEGVSISGGTSLVHTAATASGTVPSTAVVLPFGTPSPVNITLNGDLSGAKVLVPITVADFSPQVTPSTYYTAPGTNLTFTGTGFAGNEDVAVSLNGSSVGTVRTNASGDFTTLSILIPVTAHTAHFIFTGGTSGATKSADIGLSGFAPQITPSTWYAAPGSKITFSGSGFAPGETVTMLYNSATASSTVGSDGAFTTIAVTIPYNASSAHFSFNSSVTGATPTFNIGVASLAPGIWLSSYYDFGGAPLTVFGAGFGGGETVHITFEGSTLGDVSADAGGNFSLVTTVPFGPAGNKTIIAHGNSSSVNSAPVTFTQPQVFVNAQLGAYAGAPGDAVTFIGSGFLPNEPVNITTDRTGGTVVTTFNADASGSFNNAGYHIPASFTGGPLTLTVTGAHSFAPKSIVYYVTGP